MEKATRTKTCPTCKLEFTYVLSRGSDRRYCTKACRDAQTKAVAADLRKARPNCSVESCPRPIRSSGSPYCEAHYARVRRTGTTQPTRREANGTCHHCGEEAPRQRIYCSAICVTRSRTGIDGSGRECLVCSTPLHAQARYGKRYCSPACSATWNRARRYGITPAQVESLIQQQGNGCAICGSVERLVIDHDHERNVVRGMLCGTCNAGLGMLKDSVPVLFAAISYLRRADALVDQQQTIEVAS